MSVSPMVARPVPAGRSPYERQPGASRPLSVRTGPKDQAAKKEPEDEETAEAGEIEDSAAVAGDLNAQTRNKYKKGKFLGEGTYANVYAAHLRADERQKFAIKKMKIGEFDQGISLSAIREVQFLQELSHPNIVRLHDVFSSKDQNINLVIELLPLGDLEGLIRDKVNITYGPADIKAWIGMLGRGIWYCHENFVLHRDIKPNNLMFAPDGELKLADFGLARSMADPYAKMTYNTITRWYRPPELFYGARFYNGAVDMWSVGCVFAELALRIPYLAADTDIAQLTTIHRAIGSPTERNWPGVEKLPLWAERKPEHVQPLTPRSEFLTMFATLGPTGVDLLMTCFQLDPRKRCTARQFLEHRYWSADPKPTRKELLPKKGGGIKKSAESLAQMGGEVPKKEGEQSKGAKKMPGVKDPVARKLDFGASGRA